MSFAFMGLELASTMGDEMRNPSRDLPRAALLAGAVTLVAYLAVTWSLQVAGARVGDRGDPGHRAGGGPRHAAAGSRRAARRRWPLVMAVSIGGGLAAWYVGSTRVPFVAGFDHALPAALGRVHPRWGSPHVALVVQGVLSAACFVVTLAGSTVAEAYQIFLKASAITTLLPFCYMFLGLATARRRAAVAAAAGVVGLVVSASARGGLRSDRGRGARRGVRNEARGGRAWPDGDRAVALPAVAAAGGDRLHPAQWSASNRPATDGRCRSLATSGGYPGPGPRTVPRPVR